MDLLVIVFLVVGFWEKPTYYMSNNLSNKYNRLNRHNLYQFAILHYPVHEILTQGMKIPELLNLARNSDPIIHGAFCFLGTPPYSKWHLDAFIGSSK